MLESAAKGAAQALTFGFSDEIVAAAKSMFGPETYEQELKKARDELDKLEGSTAYEVGNLAGTALSFGIPAAGALKLAKKVPTLAKIIDKTGKTAKTAGKAVMTGATVAGLATHPQVTLPIVAATKGKKVFKALKDILTKKEK